jgi:hypothetical protein
MDKNVWRLKDSNGFTRVLIGRILTCHEEFSSFKEESWTERQIGPERVNEWSQTNNR